MTSPTLQSIEPVKPWYREPWPWLLMAGPAVVVVAGFVTLWLAIVSSDGLVEDDYYKQGLAINKTLKRDQAAAELGLKAQATLSADGMQVRLFLQGGAVARDQSLRLRLVRPTQAGLDQMATLRPAGAGYFEANIGRLQTGRWLLTLEDASGTWRVSGEWRLPDEPVATLVAAGKGE